MYVTRIESSVIPGKLRQYETFLEQVSALNQQAKGFLRGGVAASLGFPGRYTTISVWENRSAAEASRRSDAFQDFLSKNPPLAISTLVRPIEAYEAVSRIQDRPITDAGVIRFLDISIDPAKVQAFEQGSEELLNLIKQFGHGLISNSVCRSLSGGGRYLVYAVHTDFDAVLASVNAPEVQTFLQSHPLESFGGSITSEDRGEVIRVAEAALVR